VSDPHLLRTIEDLQQRLSEAEQIARALAGGEIDTVTDEGGSTPLLLHAAQKQLRANEQLLRAVFDGALDAMLIADEHGRYVDANPAACELFGLDKHALIGRHIAEFADAGYVASVSWDRFIEAGRARGEFPLRRPDGTKRALDFSAVANVLPGLHLSVLRDVTPLRESQRILEAAQSVAHVGSWEAGPNLEEAITWSAECARIFGGDEHAPPTVQQFFDMVHPDDRPQVIAASDRHHQRGVAFETEHRIVLPTSEVRWVYAKAMIEGRVNWSSGRPLGEAAPDGTPYSVVGIVQDITERRRVEDELRASEHRYRRIVDNTSEGVWMYDAAGVTTFLNHPMAQMLGWPAEAVIGQPIFAFMSEEVRVEARARFDRRRRDVAERGEFRLSRRDGSDLWVSLHADPLFDSAGNFEGSIALATDITERRRADEIRNQLAAIVESSEDAIISRSIDGIIRTWNRGAENLTQYTADEAVGRPIGMLCPPEHPWQSGLDVHGGAGATARYFESVVVRKDGTRLDVSIASSLLMDDHGKPSGATVIGRDISAQRKAQRDLRRSEEQLRQAQKMEAIGSLAGGVAHDFNNLLSVILSYTSLIVEELKPSDPIRGDLEEVHKAGLRATQLTRQLLAFSRQQVLQPVVLELNHVVTGIETMLVRLLREDIALTLLTSPSAGKVHADPGQIEQVIMNLVVNARDAMPQGGHLTIETGNVTIDDSYVMYHPTVKPGEYVLLAVTDTGVGMDGATRDRIFEPFYTTKEKSKGTGLGLSTVYGIVQQSGGHIWVYSELGKGSTFKVYLPRTDREVERTVAPPTQAASLRGTETILLVEDEEQVRIIMRSILRKQGYNVLEAQNGGEAFLMSEQFTAKIHLLLTDVVMPRMSGRQLAERLVQGRPDLQVLYVSGYTENTIVHHGVLDSGIEFLQKPIMPDALLRKVRQVLDQRASASMRPGP